MQYRSYRSWSKPFVDLAFLVGGTKNVSWYKPIYATSALGSHKWKFAQSSRKYRTIFFFLPIGGFHPGDIGTRADIRFWWEFEEGHETVQRFLQGWAAVYPSWRNEDLTLKQVVNYNMSYSLHSTITPYWLTTAIDLFVKVLQGQAVQNMNLAFRFKKRKALQLKAGVILALLGLEASEY